MRRQQDRIACAVIVAIGLLARADGQSMLNGATTNNGATTFNEAGIFGTLWSKTSSVYDVRRWGAAGDGATDDTTAIQNAINAACPGNSSGAVYFPVGKYKITSSLTIPVTISSASRSCRIWMENPKKGNWVNCGGQTACQSPSNQLGSVLIDGIPGGGVVFLLSTSAGQYINHIEFDNVNCWHPSTTGTCFTLSANGAGATIASITWNGGTLMNGQYGIYATERGIGTAVFFWLDIGDMEILAQGTDGIHLDARGGGAAGPIHIHNNWIVWYGNDGIWNYNTNQMLVTDNEISNENGGVGAGGYAYRCDSCALTSILRNDIEATTYGVSNGGGVIEIAGNTIYKVKQPFYISTSTGAHVGPNYVVAGGVSSPTAAVVLNTTTAASVECQLNVGYPSLVSGSGTSTIIKDCSGNLTVHSLTMQGVTQVGTNGTSINNIARGTTRTVTGTVLSASCDSGTVSITGAPVTATVMVNTTDGSDIGGAFNVRGSVTAEGTVTVYVCGMGTPPSKAYNVTVIW